ncbi:hypothetical protein MMC10_005282 [Thelotrema lepadinum]|nr:hypothetical protein [Thelotrema lepadinum]
MAESTKYPVNHPAAVVNTQHRTSGGVNQLEYNLDHQPQSAHNAINSISAGTSSPEPLLTLLSRRSRPREASLLSWAEMSPATQNAVIPSSRAVLQDTLAGGRELADASYDEKLSEESSVTLASIMQHVQDVSFGDEALDGLRGCKILGQGDLAVLCNYVKLHVPDQILKLLCIPTMLLEDKWKAYADHVPVARISQFTGETTSLEVQECILSYIESKMPVSDFWLAKIAGLVKAKLPEHAHKFLAVSKNPQCSSQLREKCIEVPNYSTFSIPQLKISFDGSTITERPEPSNKAKSPGKDTESKLGDGLPTLEEEILNDQVVTDQSSSNPLLAMLGALAQRASTTDQPRLEQALASPKLASPVSSTIARRRRHRNKARTNSNQAPSHQNRPEKDSRNQLPQLDQEAQEQGSTQIPRSSSYHRVRPHQPDQPSRLVIEHYHYIIPPPLHPQVPRSTRPVPEATSSFVHHHCHQDHQQDKGKEREQSCQTPEPQKVPEYRYVFRDPDAAAHASSSHPRVNETHLHVDGDDMDKQSRGRPRRRTFPTATRREPETLENRHHQEPYNASSPASSTGMSIESYLQRLEDLDILERLDLPGSFIPSRERNVPNQPLLRRADSSSSFYISLYEGDDEDDDEEEDAHTSHASNLSRPDSPAQPPAPLPPQPPNYPSPAAYVSLYGRNRLKPPPLPERADAQAPVQPHLPDLLAPSTTSPVYEGTLHATRPSVSTSASVPAPPIPRPFAKGGILYSYRPSHREPERDEGVGEQSTGTAPPASRPSRRGWM